MHYSLLFAFFLFTAFSAQADIPPSDDFVEDCTVEDKEQAGTECDTCFAGPITDPTIPDGGPNPGHCDLKFQGTDYEYVCSTYGASSHTQVWCDGPPAESTANANTGSTGTADDDSASESSPFGCSSMDSVASGSFFFLLGGILYARRRRSRTNT
jgi:hypothetical protein